MENIYIHIYIYVCVCVCVCGVCVCVVCVCVYRVIDKSLWNFGTRLRNYQNRRSRLNISSTCKVGQKLGVSLPLLTCSPSA